MKRKDYFDALESFGDDSVALCDTATQLSYRELLDIVTSMSGELGEAPIVALFADNCIDAALVDLASMYFDKALVNMPLFFSDEQLVHILSTTNTSLLFTDDPDRVIRLGLGFERVGSWRSLTRLARNSSPIACPAGTAKISFTSGSTGNPKGVHLRAAELLETARSVGNRLHHLSIDKHLCVLPLALLLETVSGIYAPLLFGREIHLHPLASLGWQRPFGFDPTALEEVVEKVGAHSVILVPELLKAWSTLRIRTGAPRQSTLRYVAVGGAKVGAELLKRARSLELPAYQGYGLTECGSVVSLSVPGDSVQSVGRPLEHLAVEVVHGEIEISGGPFLGYVGSSDEWTAANRFPTGDLGELTDSGELLLHGRSKYLVVTSYGRNISPEWVESALLAQAPIFQAVVFGNDKAWLTALIVPMAWTSYADVAAAVSAANESLPPYAQIASWATVESFTHDNDLSTSNGRPKRKTIEHQHQGLLARLSEERYAGGYRNAV